MKCWWKELGRHSKQLRRLILWKAIALGAALASGTLLIAAPPVKQVAPPVLVQPLKSVGVPNVNRMIAATGQNELQRRGIQNAGEDARIALEQLGKALFWDMQVGSDGVQACATCHYHAGADNRTKNQISPGLKGGDHTFDVAQPNDQLALSHYPFPVQPDCGSVAGCTDPVDRQLNPNDVTSSQGVRHGSFISVSGGAVDTGTLDVTDPDLFDQRATNFDPDLGVQTFRRVEPRNTPTTLNSVFNTRNFWDGRANLFFNGVNPMGILDPDARVQTYSGGATLVPERVMIPFSSLASQAVGPPLSDFEMSLAGRNVGGSDHTGRFADLGHKMLALTPLGLQKVASGGSPDSLLGPLANQSGTGLTTTYKNLIQAVFAEKYWGDGQRNDVCLNSSGGNPSKAACSDLHQYTLMEYNFTLFFGLAVQAYEALLVTDQTIVDQLSDPDPNVRLATFNASPLNQQIEDGLSRFLSGKATCGACHTGPEFTGASVSNNTGFGRPAPVANGVANQEAIGLMERMIMGNDVAAVYDSGFYNLGVRPTNEDVSLGDRKTAPGGAPLSFSQLGQAFLSTAERDRVCSTVGVGDATACQNQIDNIQALYNGNELTLPTSPTDLTPKKFVLTIGCGAGIVGVDALVNGIKNGKNKCLPLQPGERVAVNGTFKTAGLRNTLLTGPFFHNGSRKSIEEVIDGFYVLGGHFPITNIADFDAAIKPLDLTATERLNMKVMIEQGLTDARVMFERAPFDHPQLCVPNGHNLNGTDNMVDIPAVGADGGSVPLATFEQALGGVTSGVAHPLVGAACTITGINPPFTP
jgi:cytochrome c peroxidase